MYYSFSCTFHFLAKAGVTGFCDRVDVFVSSCRMLEVISRGLLVSHRCKICFCRNGYENIAKYNTKKMKMVCPGHLLF
jgi:hypothetical protein